MTDITFKITTYWRRPRGEPGLTSVTSKRVTAVEALAWVLGELPEGAWHWTPHADGTTEVVIDFGKCPDGIVAPRLPGRPR